MQIGRCHVHLICFVLAVCCCVPLYQHDKEKNHRCQVCPKKFGTAQHLDTHVSTVVSVDMDYRVCMRVL